MAIARSIESGALRGGDRLPSEAELQRAYGVSRTPVRQALKALEAADLIYSAQGRGSFVRGPRIVGPFRGLTTFGDELRQAGHTVEAKTLGVGMVRPDENVRRELGLTVTEDVIALRRLFLVDGEPLALFEHRIKQVIPLRALEEGHFPSLNLILDDAGFEVTDALRTIGATVLTLEDANLLQATEGAPALLIRQTSFTHTGVAVSYARFLVRADRYEYRVQVATRVPARVD